MANAYDIAMTAFGSAAAAPMQQIIIQLLSIAGTFLEEQIKYIIENIQLKMQWSKEK